MVYLILCKENNTCKIGYSNSPGKRLSDLQVGNPYKLTLEKTLVGNEELERSIHSRFAKFRLNGEWFKYTKEIKKFFSLDLHCIGEILNFIEEETTTYPNVSYKEMVALYRKNNNLKDLEEVKYKNNYYNLIVDCVKLYGKVWNNYTYAKNMVDTYKDLPLRLIVDMKNTFKLRHTYKAKEIKSKLTPLYKKYKISKTPKVIDLEEFAKLKKITNSPSGTQIIRFYD